MNVFEVEGYILLAAWLVALVTTAVAFVNSMLWSAEAYSATGKLTKPAWLAILGLGVAALLLFNKAPLNPLNLAATIAAIVYLVDVRPAVAGITRR